MSRFQEKIVCQNQNQKNLSLNKNRQSIDANTEITEMLELSENDFKAAIIKMLQCNYKHA